MIRNSSKQIDLILFDEVQLKNIRKNEATKKQGAYSQLFRKSKICVSFGVSSKLRKVIFTNFA